MIYFLLKYTVYEDSLVGKSIFSPREYSTGEEYFRLQENIALGKSGFVPPWKKWGSKAAMSLGSFQICWQILPENTIFYI